MAEFHYFFWVMVFPFLVKPLLLTLFTATFTSAEWETAAAPCRASDAAVMVMRATRSLCLSLLDNDAGKADLHRRYAAMQATATAAL